LQLKKNEQKGADIMTHATILNAKTGLYGIFFRRLKEMKESSNSEIISFPSVFEKLCRNFSITKEECWAILFTFRDFGLIEIIPYHGIKIKEYGNRGFDYGPDKNS
jgi:hypothetical protein